MKILFDHNVPYGLQRCLLNHHVSLADEMGWAEVANGELLRSAEAAGFDLMVTCDKNLSYQQNLKGRKLGLIVLGTNNWRTLKTILPKIEKAVESATAGSFEFVQA